LAKKNLCIVSGLAIGIDAVAHYNSMNEEGKTIAVVASGFNHIYPKQNEDLFYRIIDNGGCIISEYPPDTEVDKQNFIKRNSIISGIAIGTLIVEAIKKCGSTNTGRETMKQNKPLFCIPGDVDSPLSEGTNQLISEGAYLVTTPYDILDTLEYEGYPYETSIELKEKLKKILQIVAYKPRTIDEIKRTTGLDSADLNEMLLMLEIDELIKKAAGKYSIKPNYYINKQKRF
jgi:DNA processing protein